MSRQDKATYSVQTFREKGKVLVPEEPVAALDEAHAVRKAERLAAGKAGAVAIRQDGDPTADGASEPVVLKIIGRVPEPFLESLPF